MTLTTGDSVKHPASCQCPTCGTSIDLASIPRPELFLIDHETLKACVYDEVEETYSSMEELGLAHLPYSHTHIGVPGSAVISLIQDAAVEELHKKAQKEFASLELHFRYYDEEFYELVSRFTPNAERPTFTKWVNMQDFDPPNSENYAAAALVMRRVLIVLLATRNAIKVRTKDKLFALGIGKRSKNNQRPLYTTSITLPKLPTNEKGALTGRSISPHLRRGHIRQQAWGPKRSFHKAIWIEPIFVNADPTYVSTRVAYNTNL